MCISVIASLPLFWNLLIAPRGQRMMEIALKLTSTLVLPDLLRTALSLALSERTYPTMRFETAGYLFMGHRLLSIGWPGNQIPPAAVLGAMTAPLAEPSLHDPESSAIRGRSRHPRADSYS